MHETESLIILYLIIQVRKAYTYLKKNSSNYGIIKKLTDEKVW